MLQHAFKEWALICKALAEGRQALILRKGGIAETGGEFQLEHTRFWLYPTFTHQQMTGIKPEALPLLTEIEAQKPPAGEIHLSHFVEVAGVYRLHDIVGAMLLNPFHVWSIDTVQKRFLYRQPGLFAMVVRVFRVPLPHELPEEASYAGCRTWVELERELSTDGATPVLTSEEFKKLQKEFDVLLKPTAFA